MRLTPGCSSIELFENLTSNRQVAIFDMSSWVGTGLWFWCLWYRTQRPTALQGSLVSITQFRMHQIVFFMMTLFDQCITMPTFLNDRDPRGTLCPVSSSGLKVTSVACCEAIVSTACRTVRMRTLIDISVQEQFHFHEVFFRSTALWAVDSPGYILHFSGTISLGFYCSP